MEYDGIGVTSGFFFGIYSFLEMKIPNIKLMDILDSKYYDIIIQALHEIEGKDLMKVAVTTIVGLLCAEVYKICRKCFLKLKYKWFGKNR